ncbi:hypothetical protein SISSUDRAFT_469783 [Sistotremastrum suecicum HHB10207 ss-3]|uniref:Uncharacterized protein n=1 Tax=Sistotremastrum suecicum HHB10207 ss-3 TaxID=1314776 RepID=A0A165Y5I0_9AGAM|nr:hypothetical protein SISSUDRAFT_469783 [Sistotremastrum suecicum HHB10207 ss-3]
MKLPSVSDFKIKPIGLRRSGRHEWVYEFWYRGQARREERVISYSILDKRIIEKTRCPKLKGERSVLGIRGKGKDNELYHWDAEFSNELLCVLLPPGGSHVQPGWTCFDVAKAGFKKKAHYSIVFDLPRGRIYSLSNYTPRDTCTVLRRFQF